MGLLNVFRRKITATSALLKGLELEYQYTPDIAFLQSQEKVNIFIYNELMSGRRDHTDLWYDQNVFEFCGAAYTHAQNYVMWKKRWVVGQHTTPVALASEVSYKIPQSYLSSSKKIKDLKPSETMDHPEARVKGEIYSVRPQVLIDLDRAYLNGVQFKRIRVNAFIPFRLNLWDPKHHNYNLHDENYHSCRCWFYIGVPKYWDDVLDAGWTTFPVAKFSTPTKRKFPTLDIGDYYFFSKLEEDVGGNTSKA